MKRALLLISVVMVLLCVSGCAYNDAGQGTFLGLNLPEWLIGAKQAADAGQAAGIPYAGILGLIASGLITVFGVEGTRRSMKNAPEGKFFGPLFEGKS